MILLSEKARMRLHLGQSECRSRQDYVSLRHFCYIWRMQVISFYCRIIERALSRDNRDLSDLYEGTALSAVNVHEVAYVHIQQFQRFLGNALSVSQEPGLGLLVGAGSRLAGFGEMGVAALSAPTVRDGLQVLQTYSHLNSSLSELTLSAGSNGLDLSVKHYTQDDFSPIYSEVFALLVQNYLEEVLGYEFSQGHYYFSHSKPEYADQYALRLHSPYAFDCDDTKVTIPNAIAQERSPYYDAQLWRHSLQQCATQLASLKDTAATTYAAHVAQLLRSQYLPLPTLQEVASQLCLSDRTLSRKLRDEGASYRQLANDELKLRACNLLQSTKLTIDAIAADMGYLDAANFRRAFKSWTGTSPGNYRARNRSNDNQP